MTLPVFDPEQTEVAARPCEIVVHVEINGEKKREENILWTGFGPNDVYRRFELRPPIDVNRTKATFDYGLLKVIGEKAPVRSQSRLPAPETECQPR